MSKSIMGVLVGLLALLLPCLGPPVAHAQSVMSAAGPGSSAVAGRLFDGVSNLPIADGYVFALSVDRKVVLGQARTLRCACPDAGRWQITDLPSSGNVLLVGFHPSIKQNMWVERVQLRGTYADLGVAFTDLAMHAAGPGGGAGLWGLLSLAGWIAGEVNASAANRQAVELADYLLSRAHGDPSSDAQPPFRMTAAKHSEKEDLDALCRSEFGASFGLADWNDVVAFARSQSVGRFVEAIGLPVGEAGAMISLDGKRFFGGTRQYYLSRFDGAKPGHYLSHANVGGHQLDVGSWYGLSMPCLCVRR